MPSTRRAFVLCLIPVAMLSLAACATTKQMDGTDRNVITSDQIASSNAETAYDVVAKYRANFLHSRGPNSILLKQPKEPTVYLDNVEYGTINSLRNIQASSVAEIRFIEGWDAMTKYGSDHVAGVIQIYTRYQ
jgi:hypothetical protein